MMLRYFDEPNAHQEEAVRLFALAAKRLSRRIATQLDPLPQIVDEVGSKRREERDTAKVVFQRALAIVELQFFAKGLVALQDIEHIPQHLQHGAIRLGVDRRRARIETHASHFAKQIARY